MPRERYAWWGFVLGSSKGVPINSGALSAGSNTRINRTKKTERNDASFKIDLIRELRARNYGWTDSRRFGCA